MGGSLGGAAFSGAGLGGQLAGAGQLGLGDTQSRGVSSDQMGDELRFVPLDRVVRSVAIG